MAKPVRCQWRTFGSHKEVNQAGVLGKWSKDGPKSAWTCPSGTSDVWTSHHAREQIVLRLQAPSFRARRLQKTAALTGRCGSTVLRAPSYPSCDSGV